METITASEQELIKEIALSSAKDRLSRLRAAFNQVIEARNACRDFRHTLPPALREEYGIKLVTIETLCQFALIEARRAGVQGLKEEVETHDQTQTKPTVPEHG